MAASNNPTQSIDSARAARSGTSGLRFPADLGPTAMIMSFQKYSYSGTFGRAAKERTGVIALPIPQVIEDAYGLNIGPKDLGSMGAAIVDMGTQGAMATIEGAFAEGVAGAKDVFNQLTGGEVTGAAASIAQKTRYFTRSAIDGLAPGVGMALDVVNGTTVNPHTTLAFDGVNLKEFNFTWQLAPKNAAESQTLVSIRNKIRQSILPGVEGLGNGEGNGSLSRAFLSYPDLVHIYFMGILEDHYIWFKPAMIKNFNLNFSPQGGNVILEGGKPGFVQMSMTIQEAQIHTREDYMSTGSYDEAGLGIGSTETQAATQNDAIEAADTATNDSSAVDDGLRGIR
jgi:hypothetical protein